jgi:hypothetical protein
MTAMIALTTNVTGKRPWEIIYPVFFRAMFKRSILLAVGGRKGEHRGLE